MPGIEQSYPSFLGSSGGTGKEKGERRERRAEIRREFAGRNSPKDRSGPSDRIDTGSEEKGHTNPTRKRGFRRWNPALLRRFGMIPRWRVLVLRFFGDFAPKGPEQTSPGQRPGNVNVDQTARALKGRNIASIVPPLQGSISFDFGSFPMALPWADMWLPLRGGQTAPHQNWRVGLVWEARRS